MNFEDFSLVFLAALPGTLLHQGRSGNHFRWREDLRLFCFWGGAVDYSQEGRCLTQSREEKAKEELDEGDGF
jgi:hypothetical protein